MIRQLGGAFGIALSNNYIARQYAQHRSDMVSNLQENNPLLSQRINGLQQSIGARSGDLAHAKQQAYRILELGVDRQAYYLSYLDTFRLIALFFIIVMPLVFFLRVKKNADPREALKAAAEAH
jgi:DHA2 family multidrug resistance protein